MTVNQKPDTLSRGLRWRRKKTIAIEREQLGFVRQPMIEWFSPGVLLKAAIEVVVSTAFGTFSDKRELQTVSQKRPFDHSRRSELWIDVVSDSGDGIDSTSSIAFVP